MVVVTRALEPNTALDEDICSSGETVRRTSNLGELAGWRKKKREPAKQAALARAHPMLRPNRASSRHQPDSRTLGARIRGAGQLWIPECVSARPGTPDAGYIAPKPVAT